MSTEFPSCQGGVLISHRINYIFLFFLFGIHNQFLGFHLCHEKYTLGSDVTFGRPFVLSLTCDCFNRFTVGYQVVCLFVCYRTDLSSFPGCVANLPLIGSLTCISIHPTLPRYALPQTLRDVVIPHFPILRLLPRLTTDSIHLFPHLHPSWPNRPDALGPHATAAGAVIVYQISLIKFLNGCSHRALPLHLRKGLATGGHPSRHCQQQTGSFLILFMAFCLPHHWEFLVAFSDSKCGISFLNPYSCQGNSRQWCPTPTLSNGHSHIVYWVLHSVGEVPATRTHWVQLLCLPSFKGKFSRWQQLVGYMYSHTWLLHPFLVEKVCPRLLWASFHTQLGSIFYSELGSNSSNSFVISLFHAWLCVSLWFN